MQHPFLPRTYKEAIFAADDPTRTPDRVTRGLRRLRYRQLQKDITEFATLVPIPCTPGGPRSSGSAYSPGSTISGLPRVDERQDEEDGDDGGWGAPSPPKIRQEESRRPNIPVHDPWGSIQSGPFTPQAGANQIALTNRRWGPSPASVPQTPTPRSSHRTLETPRYPTTSALPPKPYRVPGTPNLPPRPIAAPSTSATPFRTPREPWRGRPQAQTANRLVQNHLGLTPRFEGRTPSQTPSSVASARSSTSHFFTPAPSRGLEPVPPTPTHRSIIPPIHHHLEQTPRAASPRSPVRRRAQTPPSRSPYPIRYSPLIRPTPRSSVTSKKPSPTSVLDKLFSRLSATPALSAPLPLQAPAATPAPEPASPTPAPTPAPPTPTSLAPGPPSTPALASPQEPERGPIEASPSAPAPPPESASSPAPSRPDSPTLTPQAIPSTPPEPLPTSLPQTSSFSPPPHIADLEFEAPPTPIATPASPTTPDADMRDRAEFDGVLGRIRNARTQLLDNESGLGSPIVSRDRHEDSRGRESVRPGAGVRGGPAYHPDERNSEVVEALKKENKEYQRDIDKLRSEVDSLLQDLTTRSSSTTNQDATLRRLTRALKEKDDALALAESALLKATAQTPSRSRYRSASPSPTRAPAIDHAATRRADEMAERVITLKSQLRDLTMAHQRQAAQLKEEVENRKTYQTEVLGAKTGATQMAREKVEVERRAAVLEQQVDTERRGRMAANSRIRELESGQQSFMGLRQEAGVLKNKLASVQQDLANANEKYRDMAKKKSDFEDKVRSIRNQGDAINEQNKQLSDQLKNQEQLLKVNDRLREDKRVAVRDLTRLRQERKDLREELVDARNRAQRLERELEINRAAQASVSNQRSEELETESRRAQLPTLASEINFSQMSLKSSRRTSPSADTADEVSDSGTETLTARARPTSRRLSLSAGQTPIAPILTARAHDTYMERRYKLQTPLHPDRSDAGSEADVGNLVGDGGDVASGGVGSDDVGSIGQMPIVVDPFDDRHGIVTGVPAQTSRSRRSEDVDMTPPAVPREASIALDTPIIPVSTKAADDPSSKVDPGTDGGGDAGAKVDDQEAKERQETLQYVNDVFSDDPMISDLSAVSIEGVVRRGRSYKEDLEYLDYDPFAGIDEEFGVSKEGTEGESDIADSDRGVGDEIEITSDFGVTPRPVRRGMDEGDEGDITDSEVGSEDGGS